jgi:hypothetical protein
VHQLLRGNKLAASRTHSIAAAALRYHCGCIAHLGTAAVVLPCKPLQAYLQVAFKTHPRLPPQWRRPFAAALGLQVRRCFKLLALLLLLLLLQVCGVLGLQQCTHACVSSARVRA